MSAHTMLDPEAHRDLRVNIEASAELGDGVMACLTFPDEFRRVQNEFPILFRKDIASGSFSALALFGFEQGENLFLDQRALGCALQAAGPCGSAVPDRAISPTRTARRKFMSTWITRGSPEAAMAYACSMNSGRPVSIS